MIDWKYNARERLKDYAAQQNAVRNLPMELEVLRSKAESIRVTDYDRDMVRSGESTREDALLSNLAHRVELERQLARAAALVELVDSALATLCEEDRWILDTMYIHPTRGKMDRMMTRLDLLDQTSVYRRVAKALARFTVAYYGSTEG